MAQMTLMGAGKWSSQPRHFEGHTVETQHLVHLVYAVRIQQHETQRTHTVS